MPPRPLLPRHRLHELAQIQDGVVSRRQLRDLGYDDDAVRANLRAGRWQRAGRVVVLHNGPLTRRQQWWVAVLSQGPVAAIGGLTAAEEHGLTGFDDDTVHVIIPAGGRPHRCPGTRVHVSHRFSRDDVHPGRSIPTVRVERAMVDAAAWSRNERRACGLLAASVQQRLTTPARLRGVLGAAGRIRHQQLLLAVLGDIEGGAQSFAEIDVGRLVAKAGLPSPRRQVIRLDRFGRRRYLDADLDVFLLEVDGALHLRPLSYWDDMARQNDLVIVTGKPILRFSTVALRIAEDIVVGQLRDAARRFG